VTGNFFDQFPDHEPNPEPADQPRLLNVESLGKEPEEVIFVDRWDDILALVAADLTHGVAIEGELSLSKDKQTDAIGVNWVVLTKAKRIVLAGTMDKGRENRREELAKRLGRHRCHLVTWPLGSENAEELLQQRGPEAVRSAIAGATPYPIDGLYRPNAAALLALRSRTPPATMTTGTRATDAILHLPTEGRLIVVTGYPAGGKTSWLRFVMVHTADKHDRRWAVFSPEMAPWEQFAADCAEVLVGKPFWPVLGMDSMSLDEIGKSGSWLEKRLTMMVCDSEEEAPNMDWLLSRARDAVLRDGVTDILLDPWNEMDHTRSDRTMTETDYIGRSLQRWKAFIQRHGCNVWIIAHPTKPSGGKTGQDVPGAYDIAASAHWANKPDLGITIHSTEPGTTDLYLWKTRFRRFGAKNATAKMEYDPMCGQYRDVVGTIAPAPDWRKPYNEDE
jgi:twinkle protein